MKKLISYVLTGALALSVLVGCGSGSAQIEEETVATGAETQEKSISVVTTIFPEYDWVREIAGGNADVDVTMLLDNGVDLHSYQPTAEDIMKIATCDVFIYVGGESDEWVEDALKEATNKDMKVVNLLESLGSEVKEEEVVEGMEAEEEEEEEAEEGEEEEIEYDEHVWLSLKNTQTLVNAIADAMSAVDQENADSYKANADSYNSKLADLDSQYTKVTGEAGVDTVLFGDRFPFRYLVDDYNLSYYAAFVGCSAETEASFETIKFLSDKVNELGLKTVFTIENSDQKIAKTIIENTNSKDAQILTLNSMQSTTSQDVADGATYLSIMEENLKVLQEGLK
ncbi:metal ABC transporter substrate-binding protein [Pseudobutyrivibrio xylanivorans]|uniref:Zinc transport system substrate-binding protein n=1 Tax=Pseudobutyrivibrio xylanivorans DSM 14809 TaxID=1123012 RepID=A0A1M6AC08_PSEXY|nr:metal ABC transporter substrate-binding protein [Pseudobutyrivibrio xylanivorans]SHI34064.1 zinc transport system substrate-binding protein [Pseudobutyrivibrio xylanivorans DSM 14809]